MVNFSLLGSSLSNLRKDGASLSPDDDDEEEQAEGKETLFPFSLVGFFEMSKGFMIRSWNVNLASGTMARGIVPILLAQEEYHLCGVYLVSLKLNLIDSRSGDVYFDEVMFRAKEMTIRMIIKRV
uniref:Uncharacterized protein n=1 Tax=Tanacetum cinerariifolium TaxID=118510 RepID=A0A699GNR3_TANCI|nr:hypothetical protein [Tanacetum cinerariifolium]